MTQFVYKSLNGNIKHATVYLVLAKSFDTIDHSICYINFKKNIGRHDKATIFLIILK